MDLGVIIKLEEIFSKKRLSFSLRDEITSVFGDKTWEELIEDFQKSVNKLPKSKIPHYTLIYSLALVCLQIDNIKDIGKGINGTKFLRNLFIGLKIFVNGKSTNFKIHADLNDKIFNNKYEYIERFAGKFHYYDISLVLYLSKLIFYSDRKMFFDLLKEDNSNLIFLNIIDGRAGIEPDYKEMIQFLNSSDELKSNGSLFYLMRKFDYLSSMLIRDEGNFQIQNELDNEIIKIKEVFNKIEKDQQLYLIVNYIFVHNTFPKFFFDIIKTFDINKLIVNLERLELDNLYKLVNIYPILENNNDPALQRLFVEHLLNFVQQTNNTVIWDNRKKCIKDILKILDTEIINYLRHYLDNFKDDLFVTDFDKHIRHKMYLVDKQKQTIINDLYEYITN